MAEIAQGDVGHLLETLHPLREPPAPEAVVPYLVLLILGIVIASVCVALALAARRRRGTLRRAAEAEMANARRLGADERLAVLARVLRRIVRQVAGEAAVRAQGRAWLERLDQLFATRFFTEGQGQIFGGALYARTGGVDVDALDREVLRLIGQVRLR